MSNQLLLDGEVFECWSRAVVTYRGEFIGCMDCKAHRKTRHLEIKLLHFDSHNLDDDLVFYKLGSEFERAFVEAIIQFCDFQGCDSVSLTNTYLKHLTECLHSALKKLC